LSSLAEEYSDDVKKLKNLMMPHLQTVLARQRRDYGIDEEHFPVVYPVNEQASRIDERPVHNIAMERQCGKVDQRLKKLGTLNAVSRSIILQRSQDLRAGNIPSFRGYKAAVCAKQEVELKWSELTKQKFERGSNQQQEIDMLDKLKGTGGPFTHSDEVQQFLTHKEK
jgi:hypothetical protein